MTAYSTFEILVVGLIVVACALGAFRRVFPKTHARLKRQAGGWLVQDGRATWMQSVGRRWTAGKVEAGGCGSGCGTCGSCGTGAAAGNAVDADAGRPATKVSPVKMVKRESI